MAYPISLGGPPSTIRESYGNKRPTRQRVRPLIFTTIMLDRPVRLSLGFRIRHSGVGSSSKHFSSIFRDTFNRYRLLWHVSSLQFPFVYSYLYTQPLVLSPVHQMVVSPSVQSPSRLQISVLTLDHTPRVKVWGHGVFRYNVVYLDPTNSCSSQWLYAPKFV